MGVTRRKDSKTYRVPDQEQISLQDHKQYVYTKTKFVLKLHKRLNVYGTNKQYVWIETPGVLNTLPITKFCFLQQ